MRRRLVAGNAKMNLTKVAAVALAEGVAQRTEGVADVEVVFCPPFVYLDAVAAAARRGRIAVGAQNVSAAPDGPSTGEISTRMLAELGCRYVIVGHSERREKLRETDDQVAAKVAAVVQAGLVPIVCVGETKAQRDAGQTVAVIRQQTELALAELTADHVRHVVIAYEPVWAIGQRQPATVEDAEQAASGLREFVAERYGGDAAQGVRILYGGAVQPDNVAGFLAQDNVDGVLVGGASLKVDSFAALVEAAEVVKREGAAS